jgi:hypothetical protein
VPSGYKERKRNEAISREQMNKIHFTGKKKINEANAQPVKIDEATNQWPVLPLELIPNHILLYLYSPKPTLYPTCQHIA